MSSSAELDKFTDREVVVSIPRESGARPGLRWRQPGSTIREASSETPQKLHPRFIITTMLIKIARNRLLAASGSEGVMRWFYDVTLYAFSLALLPTERFFTIHIRSPLIFCSIIELLLRSY